MHFWRGVGGSCEPSGVVHRNYNSYIDTRMSIVCFDTEVVLSHRLWQLLDSGATLAGTARDAPELTRGSADGGAAAGGGGCMGPPSTLDFVYCLVGCMGPPSTLNFAVACVAVAVAGVAAALAVVAALAAGVAFAAPGDRRAAPSSVRDLCSSRFEAASASFSACISLTQSTGGEAAPGAREETCRRGRRQHTLNRYCVGAPPLRGGGGGEGYSANSST